jgi:DNA-binding CsgD family transcriptional regulator
MNSLSNIVRQRSAPGVLVVDAAGRMLFANERALDLLATLRGPEDGTEALPESIRDLCLQVLRGGNDATNLWPLDMTCPGLSPEVLPPCSLRALPLGTPGSGEPPTHVMVLMERIVEKHLIDLEKARITFQLSKREADVLNLVGLGSTNKKIAEVLCISEHTVKDHIKSIMKKLGAGSRGEVVATLR